MWIENMVESMDPSYCTYCRDSDAESSLIISDSSQETSAVGSPGIRRSSDTSSSVRGEDDNVDTSIGIARKVHSIVNGSTRSCRTNV